MILPGVSKEYLEAGNRATSRGHGAGNAYAHPETVMDINSATGRVAVGVPLLPQAEVLETAHWEMERVGVWNSNPGVVSTAADHRGKCKGVNVSFSQYSGRWRVLAAK